MRPEEKALTEGLGAQYVGKVHYPTSMNTIYAFVPEGSTMADDNAEFWIVPEDEEDEVENLSKEEMQEFILELLDECRHDETTRDATWFDLPAEFILAIMLEEQNASEYY